jgi:hypothetical protein
VIYLCIMYGKENAPYVPVLLPVPGEAVIDDEETSNAPTSPTGVRLMDAAKSEAVDSGPRTPLERLSYFPAKIGRAWADGTLRERVVRKLGVELSTALGTAARYATLTREERSLDLAAGFADHRPAASLDVDSDREVLERITAAYRAAKADQPRAAKPFAVRGLWAEWLAVNFGSLMQAVERSDRVALGALLADFDREPFARGIAGSYVDVARYRRSLLGPWYVRTLWCHHRRKLAAEGLDAAELSSPNVGNPAGVLLGGRVISVEMLRYAHHALTAAGLLRDVDEPVVLEIGGGFGGQAYQILDQARRRGAPVRLYLDFDLPEVLMVASYFMLKALPGLRFRLYGEGPVTADPGAGFDVGLFPHFAVDQVERGSADLVFNTHSLSEMDELASRHYLGVVNRACRRYFMHANHEKRLTFHQPDGTQSRNVIGSELVPDEQAFKRIFRYPSMHSRPEDRPFPMYAYLYERVRPRSNATAPAAGGHSG